MRSTPNFRLLHYGFEIQIMQYKVTAESGFTIAPKEWLDAYDEVRVKAKKRFIRSRAKKSAIF